MSAKKTNISQIRKYLNGELDAHAMHQLEREAQDDPFLMDALEGYENAGTNPQPQLNDLDNRLQQRLAQNKIRRLIPWKYYAAAAAVLMVFTLGYLLWPGTVPPANKNLVADKVQPPVPTPEQPLAKPDTTILKPVEKSALIAANNTPAAARSMVSQARVKAAVAVMADAKEKQAGSNDGYLSSAAAVKADTVAYAATPYKPAKTDSMPLNEMIVMGYAAQKRANVTNSTAAVTQQLQGKIAGVQVTTPQRISGRVLDELGMPLPGVSIKIAGKPIGTTTDADGRFSLIAKNKATLDVRYIGYNSKQVEARANDSLNIALSPSTASLAEVVVTQQFKPVKPIKEAHPQMGWERYNQYLKTRAIADDGKTGNVRLSFTVDEKGQLSNFIIIKGLSDATNRQAIDLVKDGPAWAPAANGKPQTVKLKIHFGKE